MFEPTADTARVFTVEEYLDAEEKACHRSEFINGHAYARASGSYTHNRIYVNILKELAIRLDGGNCEAMPSDLRIWIQTVASFLYPDAAVVCGPPRFHANRQDTIENPTVVFEILSDSTEKYDRGQKFHAYQAISDLRQYVLISQNEALVEVFSKQSDLWLLRTYRGVDAVVELPALGIDIPCHQVYRRVEFASAAANQRASDNPVD